MESKEQQAAKELGESRAHRGTLETKAYAVYRVLRVLPESKEARVHKA